MVVPNKLVTLYLNGYIAFIMKACTIHLKLKISQLMQHKISSARIKWQSKAFLKSKQYGIIESVLCLKTIKNKSDD